MRGLKRPEQSGLMSTWGGTPKRASSVIEFKSSDVEVNVINSNGCPSAYVWWCTKWCTDSNPCTATNPPKRPTILTGWPFCILRVQVRYTDTGTGA
jgi:hypothetical protein